MTIKNVLGRVQSGYASSSWNIVRDQFSNRSDANGLVQRMHVWKAEHVRDLNVSLTYVRDQSKGRYVATVQLWADRRAVPTYEFLLFRVKSGVATIDGPAQGLPGSPGRPRWRVSRTAHFIVYHSPYQLEGSDKHYLADLEAQRDQVAREFGVTLPPRVRMYLYPDQHTMGAASRGLCGAQPGEVGCTSPFTRPPTIREVIRAIFHEPIHAYQLSLLPPPPGPNAVYVAPLFISEGMAVALEDKTADPRLSDYCSDLGYAPLDSCARIALPRLKPRNILSDSGFRRADQGDAYSLGGSFVKYLLLSRGFRTFGRFYRVLANQPKDRVSDYNVATERVYHIGVLKLLEEWERTLCLPGCRS